MTTLAPCAARASTTALPMPVLPPVTIATFPCNSSVIFHLPGAPAGGAVLSDALPSRSRPPKAIDVPGPPKSPRGSPNRHSVGYLTVTYGVSGRSELGGSSRSGDADSGLSPYDLIV